MPFYNLLSFNFLVLFFKFNSFSVLERTAISTNIKERLDFSCALFGSDGGLVSNAPHIPVHLGSMQEAVQFQVGNYFCLYYFLIILIYLYFCIYYMILCFFNS